MPGLCALSGFYAPGPRKKTEAVARFPLHLDSVRTICACPSPTARRALIAHLQNMHRETKPLKHLPCPDSYWKSTTI